MPLPRVRRTRGSGRRALEFTRVRRAAAVGLERSALRRYSPTTFVAITPPHRPLCKVACIDGGTLFLRVVATQFGKEISLCLRGGMRIPTATAAAAAGVPSVARLRTGRECHAEQLIAHLNYHRPRGGAASRSRRTSWVSRWRARRVSRPRIRSMSRGAGGLTGRSRRSRSTSAPLSRAPPPAL